MQEKGRTDSYKFSSDLYKCAMAWTCVCVCVLTETLGGILRIGNLNTHPHSDILSPQGHMHSSKVIPPNSGFPYEIMELITFKRPQGTRCYFMSVPEKEYTDILGFKKKNLEVLYLLSISTPLIRSEGLVS